MQEKMNFAIARDANVAAIRHGMVDLPSVYLLPILPLHACIMQGQPARSYIIDD